MFHHPVPMSARLPSISFGLPPTGATTDPAGAQLFCLPTVQPGEMPLQESQLACWTLLCFDLSSERPGQPSILGVDRLSTVATSLRIFVEKDWMAEFAGWELAPRSIFYLPARLRSIATCVARTPRSDMRSRAYQGAKIFELLCETLSMYDAGELVEISDRLSEREKSRLLAAKQMMLERYSEKMTIESICRASGLSRTALIRGFKTAFDCTVAEALCSIRLNQACEYLRNSAMAVSEVGFRVGYLSNAAFTRAFQKRYGVPPTLFRRAMR